MYRNVKSGRVSDSLDYMEEKWKLNGQIEKLQKDLRTTQDELKAAVEEK
jgi:cytochrome c556